MNKAVKWTLAALALPLSLGVLLCAGTRLIANFF